MAANIIFHEDMPEKVQIKLRESYKALYWLATDHEFNELGINEAIAECEVVLEHVEEVLRVLNEFKVGNL